jgi:gluconolactonase
MTTIHRLPDLFIRVLDRRFEPLCTKIASIECLYRGTRWSEGAVWFGDGRYLLWSDIPNNRVLRWEEA